MERERVEEKRVIVRVKRKISQSPVEALWIEINERPLKRPLHFRNLSLQPSSSSAPPKDEEEWKVKRVLVQHIHTVATSDAALGFLNSFVEGNPDDDVNGSCANPRRRPLPTHNIHQLNLSKAKLHQQELAKNARFQQIWKRRTQDNHDEPLPDACRLYDVLRLDPHEPSTPPLQHREMSEEDQAALAKFLPLLRECLPTAANDIESDFSSQPPKQDPANGYVYDLYTVKEKVDEVEASYPFPLVQLDDDDQYFDGLDDSDYESDDSNAENHPCNDYPEEEESSEEEKESKTSGSESEEGESGTESDNLVCYDAYDRSEEDLLYDDESDANSDDDSSDAKGGDEDWRWAYR